MDPNTLLGYFRQQNEKTIDAICELVDIESPSFDSSGSRKAVDWLEAAFRMASPGCETERIPVENTGDHLIIRFQGQRDGKPILLLGHTDTVHPRGSFAQNPTRIEDGRLYGCGTFDMKANIAVMFEVFRAFEHFNIALPRGVNILLACDEEVGSETGRPIVEREALACEFCLVFEPSADGKVKTGRKGTGVYVLKTKGVPSHAGLDPEKGASAILEIASQIEQLHGLTDFAVGTNVTVGMVKGGTATNVVPGDAECTIDVRFETMEEAARIEAAINNLVAVDKRVTLEITGEVNRPPMERTAGVAGLFTKAKEIALSFGYELEETQVGGASDGNFVGALGVPVLDGLGIKGNGAHTLEEFVVIDDIPFRAALLSKLLLED